MHWGKRFTAEHGDTMDSPQRSQDRSQPGERARASTLSARTRTPFLLFWTRTLGTAYDNVGAPKVVVYNREAKRALRRVL